MVLDWKGRETVPPGAVLFSLTSATTNTHSYAAMPGVYGEDREPVSKFPVSLGLPQTKPEVGSKQPIRCLKASQRSHSLNTLP